LRRKGLVVALLPGILLLWLIAWCMIVLGQSQTRMAPKHRKKVSEETMYLDAVLEASEP
jgi:hypothetical protein